MTKILLVEDDEKMARFIELELIHEGYDVKKCGSGREGLSLAESGDYHLILLDIMLPELSGLEVLRRLRKSEDEQVPVILLTARDSVADKVSGLDMGADDYITKPFSIEELLARIRSALRKQERREPHQLHYGPLEMDLEGRLVTVNGKSVDLTGREFDLLCYLMENSEIVLSRDQILNKVWGYDYPGESNIVDVYIRYLRSKIAEFCDTSLVQTVRGVGYTLRMPQA